MQSKKAKHCIKIQNHQIAINYDTKSTFTTQVVFSFNSTLLPNAKKLLGKLDINPLSDVSKVGNITLSTLHKQNIIVLSLGDKTQLDLSKFFKAIKALANFVNANHNIKEIDLIYEDAITKQLELDDSYAVEQLIFNLFDNLYYFDNFKTDKKELHLNQLNIVSNLELKNEITNAISMLNGIYLIKNLGNNPANVATPTYLANIASSMTKLSKKVECKILDKKEIEALGMHSFLSVSAGSDQPPKLISLNYKGSHDKKPIVLVGKGVTFDCGGVSIKPALGMNEMKYDMMGAATVLGVFQTVVELGLPINLRVVAPCTENMINGSATKPGDIVTSMSGKTIEILNTDAEGRLALCDALTYVEQFNPELVIDMATLTGACIIALGHAASGLYGNDEKLIQSLIKSSNNTLDKVWHMPLFDEYEEGLTSGVADLSNIGGGWTTAGGSAVAAKFLSKFVNYKWAHLDIAGVTNSKGTYDGKTANGGATGRPFNLIIDFLRNYK